MSPDSPPTPDATPQPTPQPAHDPTPDDGWADLFRRLLSLADPPADTAAGRPAYDAVAADLLARLRPRDPAEELLAVQMLATHARALFLARHANRQKNPKWFALYSAHAQQSADLFRRQMLALAEYRRPRRRRSPTFNAIRHANIAQVVTSPLPSSPEVAPVAALPQNPEAALPPVPRRPPRPLGQRRPPPAVAPQHRPPVAPGQGDRQPERPQTRPPQPPPSRPAPGVPPPPPADA